MRAQKLSEQEISAEMARLNGWRVKEGKLHRTFECKDFVQAFARITEVALMAEAMNHHPEWSNVWNRVTFDLTTHSANGITQRDFELAHKIEQIFAS